MNGKLIIAGTVAGARAFEACVSQAAMAACQEVSRRFHNARPGDEERARQATEQAMAQVRQVEVRRPKGSKRTTPNPPRARILRPAR